MGVASDEPQRITFHEAIATTANSRRYLLLGNGFSISARDSFTYPSLFRRAGPFSEAVATLFRDLQTEDFERVLNLIKPQVEDARISPEARAEFERQESEVRAAFIQAVQRVHPDSAAMMGNEECERCISFLEHFVGRSRGYKSAGRIYTTNYDLLLYWVLARGGRRLLCYDSHISDLGERRYGVWHPEKPPGLVYLHGALHLYETPGHGQAMLRYDGQRSLIAQARARLDRGSFPVIVSEGTSEAKAARIARSNYLTWGSNYLRSGLRDRDGVLFTYGHSLDDRDSHLLRKIGSGRVGEIYIGAYGGLDPHAASVGRWMSRWSDARREGPRLRVYVYDTKDYSPWKA